MKKYMILAAVFVLSTLASGDLLYAHDYWRGRDSWHNRGYYPEYRHHNPVVRRDYYGREGYAPDGTYHREDKVVDRHSSYYSPGRNQAITRPRTTVRSWSDGHGQTTTRERTSWIGADGRPHSTTITRDTSEDRWGNTHTDTRVDLRRAKP